MVTVATIHSEALPGSGRPSRVQLVVVEGPDRGRAVSLDEGRRVVAGTAGDCDLILTDDRASRQHMAIARDGGAFDVEDLGSTNGTLFEGSLLNKARVGVGAAFKL